MTGSSMKDVIMMFIEAGRMATALVEAARWGEPAIVEQLLGNGVSVNAKAENGCTALMTAASGQSTNGATTT